VKLVARHGFAAPANLLIAIVRTACLSSLAAALAAFGGSNARADNECFTAAMSIDDSRGKIADGDKEVPQYLLGLDRLLVPVAVQFFPDGRVCGVTAFPPIRFQGRTVSDGQINLTFLPSPPEDSAQSAPPDPANASPADKQERRQKEFMARLFRAPLTGTATRQQTDDLILWDGRLKGADGTGYDFYLKRTRPTARKPPPGTKDMCGDGGCDPLTLNVVVKKGSEAQLLKDAKNMAISKIVPVPDCETRSELKKDEVCFLATAWPFEESNVVKAFKLKAYVRHAQRTGGASGVDTENMYLQSDKLLSANRSLNQSVVIPLFQDAIARHFEGTGLVVPDPAPRKNSLFWDLKGQRYQFEKKANPSPSDKSEWWKVRLQIAVTEGNSGTYLLLISLPETRVVAWGLSSVPNDEKFTTEVTNDDRFVDLQARLMTAITKFVPATKEAP
jgi:hypothetical protein